MSLEEAAAAFLDPPREFGLIPFWFWNDDLDEGELRRQLRAMHDAGFGGVIPSGRIGLSRRTGYLGAEYLRLIRAVAAEADRLGMKVILYDECSYPSGSAQGAVVRRNPAFASRAIGLWQRPVDGPCRVFWRPNTGRDLTDTHVCTVLGRTDPGGGVDPASLRLVEPGAHDVFELDVPAGNWAAMSVWCTHSGGQIRGAYPEEDSGHATAPAAGDILNPEAVACFLQLTHDVLHRALREHFGRTVIGMFTDEPGVFGKGAQRPRQAQPFTVDLVPWLERLWREDPRPWLPALWVDYGAGTERFRQRYAAAIRRRLHEVFYGAQTNWCRRHGIALTGHPSGSGEMTCLRYFDIPGQDMVWRYVQPGDGSGVRGPHSVAARAATSGARITGARRVLTEVGGAYGWRLSLDELKWLFDWHLVRGNNLIVPHAAFYSIRGRRAWESEPDVGVHNVFWPHFRLLAAYARRLSWMLCDGTEVCQTAIVGDGEQLPWEAARTLYESQVSFLYLDDRAVADGSVRDGRLLVGRQRFANVVVDGEPALGEAARHRLAELAASGGQVLRHGPGVELAAALRAHGDADLEVRPAQPDLRFLHYQRSGLDLYLLVNEGEGPIEAETRIAVSGAAERWDPLTGERAPLSAAADSGGLRFALHLERRQSLVVAVDPQLACRAGEDCRWQRQRIGLAPAWTATAVGDAPDRSKPLRAPGDWSRQPGWELFSGTVRYQATVSLPAADRLCLDLGQVGDSALVMIDGQRRGTALWAPYVVDLGPWPRAGSHLLEVEVTNSMANEYEGLQLPSGLLGPLAACVDTRAD